VTPALDAEVDEAVPVPVLGRVEVRRERADAGALLMADGRECRRRRVLRSGAMRIDASIDAPLDAYRDVVRHEWIDHNGHMNMGYYLVVFDLATDEFMRWIGLDADHRRLHRVTTFCLEAHVTYQREVRDGDPLRFTTQLLAHDEKRLHYVHAMYHAVDGYLAATNELMSLHVALETRRGAAMAPSVLARLAAVQAAHAALPRPPQVGRVMGLGARPTTR
jgi:acyl-CoA thioester hydrolase